MLRPVLLRSTSTPATRARAQQVVEQFGRSSLARFTLFLGKAHWISLGGSVIAYTVRGRVALALGDPIGPTEDIGNGIVGFLAFCRHNDWQTAFYQTSDAYLDAYQSAGLMPLCIGHEGIVNLHAFSLSGASNKTIRANINKLGRIGYRAEMRKPTLSSSLMLQLRAISDEWLAMMHGRELRFSMGRFDEEYVQNSLVMAVHGPDDSIVAFANLVPEYQQNEIAVDLMRRQAQLENGTMDFLFVSLFGWAKEAGYDTFNLGLSALCRRVGCCPAGARRRDCCWRGYGRAGGRWLHQRCAHRPADETGPPPGARPASLVIWRIVLSFPGFHKIELISP